MTYSPGSARNLRKVGSWFRDAEDRHVILRGVNLGGRAKQAPYLPIYPAGRAALDPVVFARELEGARPELQRLQAMGFNVVRLLVMWKALEPAPLAEDAPLSPEAARYLDCVRAILDALHAHGMFAILDVHQDIAHELFGGDGFPDWTIPDGVTLETSPPSRMWGGRYLLDARVRSTLRAFWDNDLTNTRAGLRRAPVQDYLARTVGRVAERLRGHPAVLGYQPFNEPNGVGIAADRFEGPRGWSPGRPAALEAVLPGFYGKVIQRVRKVDEEAFVFVQPRVDWTVYGPRSLHFLPDAREPETQLAISARDDRRLVFSFHHYDPWTVSRDAIFGFGDSMVNKEREWPATFAAMIGAANYRGLVPFMTEHGADHHWSRHKSDIARPSYQNSQVRAYVDLQFRQIEGYLLSSAYWQFDLYNTPAAFDGWNDEDFSMLGPNRQMRHEDIQCRPFPHRSAARPVFLSFDVDTKLFILVLEGAPVAAPTMVYVPEALHYAGGFDAHATGLEVKWDAASRMLTWRHAPEERSHLLVLAPRGAAFPPAWPEGYLRLAHRPAPPRLSSRLGSRG